MNKLFRSIFTVFLAVLLMVVFTGVPEVRAADRGAFSVDALTILKDVQGFTLRMATKVFSNVAPGTTWILSKAEALANFLKATGSGSCGSIIAPRTTGRIYVVRNATDKAITIRHASGSDGISIATGTTAIVIFNGTSDSRLTADAAN